jgi:GT2 family glycosyltransferase
MLLSIIIVNFNTLQLTTACIWSIKEHTIGIDYEIIVVDNAPRADYRSHFEQTFPEIKYIKSPENIGFGRANNLGMDAAAGKYFLLLNSDTIVFDSSLQRCIAFMEQHTDVGMLGCKLLNEDGYYQSSFYPFRKPSIWNYMATGNPILSKLTGAGKRYRESDSVREVGDIAGAFMLLRRDVYQDVKGFDPDFFLYCEETEWCRNRIALRYKICYFPEASIVHLGGKSAPQDAMQLQMQISQGLYWYKTGWFSYILYMLFNFLNCFYYACTYLLAGAAGRKSIRSYISAFRVSIPYLFRNIPRYPREYNSRHEPLIYEGARALFFGRK